MDKESVPFYTAIELGTSTIKVLIAEFNPRGELIVRGHGKVDAVQMRKGEIFDVQNTKDQLRRALKDAEYASNVRAYDTSVFLALSGSYVRTVNTQGEIEITREGGRIQEQDIAAAVEIAKDYNPPAADIRIDRYVRQHRLADGTEYINSLGQCSSKLCVEMQHIIADQKRLNTVCGLVRDLVGKIDYVCYVPLACGAACIPPARLDKPQDGRLVIDLGAGMTSYSVFTPLGCYHSGQLAVGCDHIANDLAIAYSLHIHTARSLLEKLGSPGINCTVDPAQRNNHIFSITTQTFNDRQRSLDSYEVEDIISMRLSEIFEVVRHELEQQKAWRWIPGDILLTGGGAMIPGILPLANHILKRPVLQGKAFEVGGVQEVLESPAYIAAIGLIRAGRLYQEFRLNEERLGRTPSNLLQKALKTFLDIVNP